MYDITCTILANGDLRLTADNETRSQLASDLRNPQRGYWSAFCDAMESYSCNGSYTPFDAGDGNPFVGLTSAPCIAESMDIDDNGECSIQGRFWYFDNYMIVNDMQQLSRKGYVTYTLGSN